MKRNITECVDMVNKILFGEPMMLMTKPIKKGTIKNKLFENSCTGYSFEIDNLSYRGIWVSTIESISLIVDGEAVDDDEIIFCINGMKISGANLSGHTEVFWDPQSRCVIEVNKVKGLCKGNHNLKLQIVRRPDFGHSYGEGTQGYETAYEFVNAQKIVDEITFIIE